MIWDDVRFFLALSRRGSVRAAGALLGVSHSTVARRIEALEQRLNARLFDRTPEGFVLTDAGAQMLPAAERVEAEVATMERGLVGRDERFQGVVRITCADPIISDVLVKESAAFCRRFPEIELEMTNSLRTFDLAKREADIAFRVLRLGKAPPEHLIGKKLARLFYANYVAREHAARLDPARVGSETRWLGWGTRASDEAWVRASSYPDVPVWGSFESPALQRQAVRAGLGIGCLPCFVGDRDPALQRLEQPDRAPYFDVWILSHPDLRTTARLQSARATWPGRSRPSEPHSKERAQAPKRRRPSSAADSVADSAAGARRARARLRPLGAALSSPPGSRGPARGGQKPRRWA